MIDKWKDRAINLLKKKTYAIASTEYACFTLSETFKSGSDSDLIEQPMTFSVFIVILIQTFGMSRIE